MCSVALDDHIYYTDYRRNQRFVMCKVICSECVIYHAARNLSLLPLSVSS